MQHAIRISNVTPSSSLPNMTSLWKMFFGVDPDLSFYLLIGTPCLYKMVDLSTLSAFQPRACHTALLGYESESVLWLYN